MKISLILLSFISLPSNAMHNLQDSPARKVQRDELSKKLNFYDTLVAGDNKKLKNFPLKKNIGVEYEISQETPLLITSAEGHAQCAQLLIDAGACVNQKFFGKKPLTLAAQNLYYKTVKTLVEAGAKISLKEWTTYKYMKITDKQKKYHQRIVRYLFIVNKDNWLSELNKRYIHE